MTLRQKKKKIRRHLHFKWNCKPEIIKALRKQRINFLKRNNCIEKWNNTNKKSYKTMQRCIKFYWLLRKNLGMPQSASFRWIFPYKEKKNKQVPDYVFYTNATKWSDIDNLIKSQTIEIKLIKCYLRSNYQFP